MSTTVCEHVGFSASCHLYWISPGGVLSPLLYILYTYDCRSNQGSSYLVTFTDNGVLLFLLLVTQGSHGAALDDFTEWCDESYLYLNVNKTKETIADFRRWGHTHRAI